MSNSVQRACYSIPEFRQRYEKFSTQLQVEQYSPRSIISYGSKLSALCLHFNKLPDAPTSDDCRAYFSMLLSGTPSVGVNSFKHTIYGLRCYCRIMGLPELKLSLPSIRKDKKLPVVLSQPEICRLLSSCADLRSKALLGLIYSCGLRLGESRQIKISDIDSGRMLVHIKQGKGRKDRYVALSSTLLLVLRAYFKKYRPTTYLFNGPHPCTPITETEVYFLFKSAVHASGIRKPVTLHTLRHSFATHLLEMGMNILQIKECMGHSNIKTTMTYLHVAPAGGQTYFSPLDRLFTPNDKNENG